MKKIILLTLVALSRFNSYSQVDSMNMGHTDSSAVIQQMILQENARAKMDSLIKVEIQQELAKTSTNSKEKEELEEKLKNLQSKDSLKRVTQLAKIENLKKSSKYYPVVLFTDTLFNIYTKIGSFTPKMRADAISERVLKLYKEDFLNIDSISLLVNEGSADIVYKGENIIMTVTEIDALWQGKSIIELGTKNMFIIKTAIEKYKQSNSLFNVFLRIGQIVLILFCLGLLIYFINKFFKKSSQYLINNQDRFLNGVTIKNFKVFTPEKHRKFAQQLNNILRIAVIILMVYLSLPLIFSLFPETKSFTDTLIGWVLSPAKRIFGSIIGFLPNLFTILVIIYIARWAIKGIQYFFTEIENGSIVLGGFHKDWAMPTFNIIKFVLYAFMLVVIFPYLPGSDSAAFQGVSVFLGVLFSLGSSSAITNMIAGLVITYMRPFKIGDRVKIGEVQGDVVEKTMLVTRIRTIKNEDITVPNSAVLSSHTINYSSNAQESGLIIHTTVTIGYDVPWKKMHEALLNAADRNGMILKDPKPFVLQTSLDDFYVSYQLNGYTREASKQAVIYSELHKHIQDCCNEMGIEILSPHYRAQRDGSHVTIPTDYLGKDYKAPNFNVHIKKDE